MGGKITQNHKNECGILLMLIDLEKWI